MKVWNGKTKHRFAHIKRDGHMIAVSKDATGRVTYRTRGYDVVDLSYLRDHLQYLKRVPTEVSIHCELWKPGEPASYVSRGIARRDCDMILEPFAVARGLPAELGLAETQLELRRWGLPFIPFYARNELHPLSIGGFTCTEAGLAELPIDTKLMEGYVLKDSNFTEFYKYKPFRSVDLRVVDVKPGNGKYSGMIGSFECSLSCGTVVAHVSGMDDATRRLDPSCVLGRIVEVKYQYVGAGGRLRHPNFLRFRDDKLDADSLATLEATK